MGLNRGGVGIGLMISWDWLELELGLDGREVGIE